MAYHNLDRLTTEELRMFMNPNEDNSIQSLENHGWNRIFHRYGFYFEKCCPERGMLRVLLPNWCNECIIESYELGRNDIKKEICSIIGIHK